VRSAYSEFGSATHNLFVGVNAGKGSELNLKNRALRGSRTAHTYSNEIGHRDGLSVADNYRLPVLQRFCINWVGGGIAHIQPTTESLFTSGTTSAVSARSERALTEPSGAEMISASTRLKGRAVTTTVSFDRVPIAAAPGVYAPQHDSYLLIDALEQMGDLHGRTAADLCTGSGVVAIAAACLGAAVTAWDVCPVAARCARDNAAAAGVRAEILLGPLEAAIGSGPFDIVLSNPPYVPTPTRAKAESVPVDAGPPRAWNAGPDGRRVLDRLCRRAPSLLTKGGTMLVVQSEFAGIEQSVNALRTAGLSADVMASQRIPFGPVLNARAGWLERTGRLTPGCREETLAVIRADK
jgi:release factor glutamine methyltransferase